MKGRKGTEGTGASQPGGKAERAGLFSLKKRKPRGWGMMALISVYKCQWGGCKEDEASGAWCQDRAVPSEHQGALLYCGDDGAPAQVSRRGDGVSPLGHIQKPSGQGAGQLARAQGPGDLQRSLPTSTIL